MRRLFFIVLVMFTASLASADEAAGKRTIKVVGRTEATVTRQSIFLNDIASITSRFVKDDDEIIALQKIQIAPSPLPGKETTISASRILERMREEGVNLNKIGYAFPRIITVKRAARAVTLEEVQAAIENYIANSGRDVELKQVHYRENAMIAPGAATLEATPFNTGRRGELGFIIKAAVEGEKPVRFKVRASVDQWQKVPVANRPINRGAVISKDDVMMARMNVNLIPRDAARDPESIIGLETSKEISYGEVFRKNKLSIPPVIETGAPVTLTYKSRFFQATATGTAIEDGIVGQEIRVRNNSSRKVVRGTVLEAGLVEVRP
ncbi:MAG: flagella basal body P-ring formation protein FlgA [Candidatus Dadabacteria bacterium]|nr:MAG: flagella basal body P-ring formation protein FlgA [Candidatus Dadabacteria bacterium]